MKIEGYEEVSHKEYNKLPSDEGLEVWDCSEHDWFFFKKAQKFPICFEDEDYEIEVDRIAITITGKLDDSRIVFGYKASFPLLVKAVEKAKEVMKKNGTN